MPLKLNAFSGGSVTLNPASTASDFTLTLPAASGTAIFSYANGNVGIGNVTPTHALSINGALRTTALSTNYAQSDAVSITVNTTTPTAVCSVTLTTLGKPVLLLAAGDRNPLADATWHWGQFFRDSTPIGKVYIGQQSFASYNQPFAHCHVDTPAAGTYSYQFRVWQGSGSIQYGETGNSQAPTIIAMELI